MKRFAFSLQKMLGFKRTMYERERNVLLQLRAEKVALEQRRDEVNRRLSQLEQDYQRQAEQGVTMLEVMKISYYRQSGQRVIDQLQVEMDKKEAEIEKQLLVVVELDKEVKSLEKLRESQWEEYQMQEAAEEKERILELVSRQYVDAQTQQTQEAKKRRHLPPGA